MITVGIDMGNQNTKIIILKDGEVLVRHLEPSGFDQKKAAREAYDAALKAAGISENKVDYVIATGAGQDEVSFASECITDISSLARGVVKLFPQVRTIIDVGAEEARVLKTNENGKAIDFAINEKCAAGTGSFVESMSRALEVSLEEMGLLSLQAEKAVPMNAQCAVFAESEVISLIHARIPKAEIAKSIHKAMASRISSMIHRVGIQKEVAMVGGLAHNRGFIATMEEDLELAILIPADYPEYVSAYGAALAAVDKMEVK